MKTLLSLFLLLLLTIPVHSASAEDRPEVDPGFETVNDTLGFPQWGGGPLSTIKADSTVFHSGKFSARLTRDLDSENEFSSISKKLPVDFKGQFITLRGFLRTNEVQDKAQLWMRQDNNGKVVAFSNMKDDALKGSQEWTYCDIRQAVIPGATHLAFGALISGTGTLWVDELEILVDGVPYLDTEWAPRVKTILDEDSEFLSGSMLALAELQKVPPGNLQLLGKVWGFLKYHHPTVTSGQRHWDFDLFRILPEFLYSSDIKDCQSVLVQWIQDLGPMEPCSPCADTKGQWQLEADLSWLDDEKYLGQELSRLLLDVYRHRPADGEQFFVEMKPHVGNPDFDIEQAYESLQEIDPGYRLLALYRFWNIIEYWFPSRDIMDEDWDAVLAEFVPRVLAAAEFEDFQLELVALIALVHDTHANLWSGWPSIPPQGKAYLPFAMRFLDGEAVVFKLFPGAEQLELGDVVESLDGRLLAELIEEHRHLYAASNEPTRLRDMGRLFLRGPEGPAQVSVRRGGKRLDLELERSEVDRQERRVHTRHDRPGPTFQRISPELAYLKLSTVSQDSIDFYLSGASGSQGWVLDLRNYPSAFLVFSLGGHLVAETTPFVRFTHGQLNNPGYFSWSEPLSVAPLLPAYPGKIAILVDETTQSSAEYHAMAFRAATGAVVIGSTTAGADGNVSRIVFPGAEHTMISGIGIFYPDKSPTQRVGIVPDQVVIPTREGIKEGRDEVLEAAVRHLLDRSVSPEEMKKLLNQSE